ncbi:MAG: GNAT family N-acetyltransferase [Anaerolineales bacterium]
MPTSEFIEIRHNPEENRFQIEIESYLAVLEYQLDGDTIVFTHTGVPDELGGRGLGSKLVRAGLDYARAQGLRVHPLCSFVASYIEKKPEYQDLLKNG